VLDEELRSRLQALAVAGQATANPATKAAVRRRGRRKVQGGVVTVVVFGLLLAAVGMQVRSELGQRRSVGPVPPVAPPAGLPAAVAPTTFVGQVGNGATRHTAIIDARTGRILRHVPGTERRSDLATDAVVGPDLGAIYLPTDGSSPTAACDRGWTQVDLTTGTRRPAFGGLTGVREFSLSADGRWLAFVHTTGPGTPNRAAFGTSCRTEQLVVRELASGWQRVWTIPPGASVEQVQLSPDATRLVYLLEKAPGEQRPLHVLPLAGTTSVTQGDDLPAAGDCPPSNPRFLGDSGRLIALGGSGCGTGPRHDRLSEYDLAAGRVVSSKPLGLRVEIFGVDVDRSGRHLIIAAAGTSNDQRPATAYVLRNGRPQRVPLPGDCWQADW
jgi:hypothetical protein